MIERDFLKGNTLEQIEDLARRVGDLERAVSLGLFQQDQTLAAPGRISVPAGAEYQVAGQPLLGQLVAPFLALPGLRGLWPMSAFDSAGNAQDVSGHGHHLTYNGNPVYGYDGLVPYIDFDGVGDYLDRADEADFDILGSESHIGAVCKGLTLGGWFYIHTMPAAAQYPRLMSKGTTTGSARSYALYVDVNRVVFLISADGATFCLAETPIAPGIWTFVAGRYKPGTESAVFCNEVVATNVTSIPASLYDAAVGFGIGGQADGTKLIEARASLCWFSAAAVADEWLGALFQQTRGFFGV